MTIPFLISTALQKKSGINAAKDPYDRALSSLSVYCKPFIFSPQPKRAPIKRGTLFERFIFSLQNTIKINQWHDISLIPPQYVCLVPYFLTRQYPYTFPEKYCPPRLRDTDSIVIKKQINSCDKNQRFSQAVKSHPPETVFLSSYQP